MISKRPITATRLYAGIFCISASTLLLELAWTRVLSVTLWYHFAFMALSTALFGFGFAGVFLSMRSNKLMNYDRLLIRFASITPIAFVTGYLLFNGIPFEPFSLSKQPIQWLFMPLAFLFLTFPFFFAGATIAILLTRYAERVHELYFFDLAGAGVGSIAFAGILPLFGGSGSVFFAGGIAGVGAIFICHNQPKKIVYMSITIACTLLALAPFADKLFPVRVSTNKSSSDGVPLAKILNDPAYHRHTEWNSISRIDVIDLPRLNGPPKRVALFDGGTALTRISRAGDQYGHSPELFFTSSLPSPKVLIVGSGGGHEVRMALEAGASKVVGVEINETINNLVSEHMADYTGRLYDDPRVEIHTDEARSFLRRDTNRYDVIVCPHTISNAAMTSGSLSLAESYLMTAEAFEDYFSHLNPSGILIVTRPEAHLPRLVSTIQASLSKQGVTDIDNAVLAWKRPSAGLSFYAGVAVKPSMFGTKSKQQFSLFLGKGKFHGLLMGDKKGKEPYLSIISGQKLSRDELPFAAILEPATDDRPYFNQRVPLSDMRLEDLLFPTDKNESGRDALETRPLAEAALVALLVESAILSFLFVLLPLIVARRRSLSRVGRTSSLLAFAALGLAYITVEVGLIQHLLLYLGRPVVVFSTTLGTLLITSGLGSGLSKRFSHSPLRACLWAGLVGLITTLMIAPMTNATLHWSEPARVFATIAMLTPVGIAMGAPFPMLISYLKERYPERIPWALGLNGFASVIGTITSVLIGMLLGQRMILFFGVSCYAVSAVCVAYFTQSHKESNV